MTIASLMRKLVVERPGGPTCMELRRTAPPVARPGEVLVVVEASGVNPVDCGNRTDPSRARLRPPYTVGYEFSGHLAESGEPVWGLLPVRGSQEGALADLVAVPEHLVAPRPTELDAVTAGALPLSGCTALQVVRRLGLPAGSWVLVHGATGGVGHLLVQMLHRRGVHTAAPVRASQRERLEGHGLDLWVDRFAAHPAQNAVVELGHEVDAVVDLVGGQLVDSVPQVREGGGVATIVDLAGDFDEVLDRNLDVHGVLVRPGREALADLAVEVEHGVRPDVVATRPLPRAAEAHRMVEAGSVGGRVVVGVA